MTIKPIVISVLLVTFLRPSSAQSADASRVTPAPATPSTPADLLAVNPLTGLTSASAVNYQSPTGKDRWKLYWRQNYASVGAYSGPVLSALVFDQATGSPSEWGGGFEGLGKRLGSRTLSAIIQGNVQAGLAVPLHEDVRYIAAGQGRIPRRILHAIAFSFLTYNSQGHTTLNIANLSGYYAATAISTEWIPVHDPLGQYILIHGSEQVGLSIPVNVLQEFWPDLRRKLFRRP